MTYNICKQYYFIAHSLGSPGLGTASKFGPKLATGSAFFSKPKSSSGSNKSSSSVPERD